MGGLARICYLLLSAVRRYENILNISLIIESFCFQTAVELNKELMRKSQNMSYPANAFSSFAYDAIWSIALALQKLSPVLKARNKSLSSVTYGDMETTELFKGVLRNLSFIGMSVSGYTANLQLIRMF